MRTKFVLAILTPLGIALLYWLAVAGTVEPELNSDRGQADGTGRAEVATLNRVPQPASTPPVATKVVAASPVVEPIDGYIGSDSCRECHQDYHQSWHASYHRTMTQEVTPATAPEAIHDSTVRVQGETYIFSRRGDDFLVELDDPIEAGQRMTRRLVLITGSHHAHLFWYESGIDKTPAQLQIMWVIDQQRWIPRKSFFLRPPNMAKENELGRWNQVCCHCHSTHPRARPDSEQLAWDTRVVEFGIACEACHGPGEDHVAFHRQDANAEASTLEGLASDPIVNPQDLPADRRSDLCGQCHGMMMVSFVGEGAQEQFYDHGRQFRPGDDIEKARFLQVIRASKEYQQSETFQRFAAHPGAVPGHFWSDGEMRVTGRDYTGMVESKCFQEGDLSCLSCHTMHQQDVSLQSQWKDDQLLPDMRGDSACLQCHPKYKELGSQHTHHPVDSQGSRCMNCHMPHTIYGVLKSSRSHTISIPSVTTTVETGRPNACNLCHLDHTLEETATQLQQWYGIEKPQLTEVQKTTAASLLHLLRGDAAQRVLQFNAFQWPPAQQASGTDWMRLFVLLGMEDQYDAIRLIADRAYKTLPDAPPLNYDFLASPQQRSAALGGEYMKIFAQPQEPNESLLIGPDGFVDKARIESLLNQRDQRPVYLQE